MPLPDGGSMQAFGRNNLQGASCYAAVVAITFAFSAFTCRWVETPGREWTRRWVPAPAIANAQCDAPRQRQPALKRNVSRMGQRHAAAQTCGECALFGSAPCRPLRLSMESYKLPRSRLLRSLTHLVVCANLVYRESPARGVAAVA